jgi:hypothetical protein
LTLQRIDADDDDQPFDFIAGCLIDGAELIEHGEMDGDESGVFWASWFECAAPARHYYRSARCGWKEMAPTDEEFSERYPVEAARIVAAVTAFGEGVANGGSEID